MPTSDTFNSLMYPGTLECSTPAPTFPQYIPAEGNVPAWGEGAKAAADPTRDARTITFMVRSLRHDNIKSSTVSMKHMRTT